jgi:hypothetical protein
MKTEPRIKLWTLTAVSMTAAVAMLLTGCKLFGADPAAPNAVEKVLFTTKTNFVEVPVQVSVTNYVNKELVFNQTNTVGQIVTVTNEVQTPVYSVVTVTNIIPQYQNTVSPSTTASVTGASGILNYFFPGSGPIVSAGILALLGGWAQLRSSKRQDTSAALAQEAETILEFIKTLPNGAAYKQAITTFMQAHQLDAGVADQVLGLLDNEVSNPDAKAAVEEIRGTLSAVSKA